MESDTQKALGMADKQTTFSVRLASHEAAVLAELQRAIGQLSGKPASKATTIRIAINALAERLNIGNPNG
jgi:hypothetical protein